MAFVAPERMHLKRKYDEMQKELADYRKQQEQERWQAAAHRVWREGESSTKCKYRVYCEPPLRSETFVWRLIDFLKYVNLKDIDVPPPRPCKENKANFAIIEVAGRVGVLEHLDHRIYIEGSTYKFRTFIPREGFTRRQAASSH